MVLKGALHTHTTCSDGELSWQEVLAEHRAQGFDFIALTDHDFLKKPNAYDAVPEVYEGMLVFRGVEKTVFAKGYVHVNIIPGHDEVIHIFNHPSEYEMTFAQTLERMAIVQKQLPLHACEVSSKGFYTPEYDTSEIALPKVVSDDSHTREAIGRAWVEVDAPRGHDAILRAIKEGGARLVYKNEAQPATGWH